MTAFERAFTLLKFGVIGVKGTPCPQCGAQYDPEESEWSSTVGYSTQFREDVGHYICHDCDINFQGPAGTGETREHNPENWQVGETEGMDMIISPAMKGGDMMEQLGAFMQERSNPGCDEAKRAFIQRMPENSPNYQEIVNETMSMDCDAFIQMMEDADKFYLKRGDPAAPANWVIEAANHALAIYRMKAEGWTGEET